MSIPLTINGQTFEYPVNFDENWGVNATGWAQAVTNGMLQRTGGNFPLLADANFGASFGLVAKYYKSESANIASSGVIRLANSESISWRNDANTGNLPLAVDSMDQLTYNGLPIAGGGGAVTAIIGTANQIIASSPSGVVTLSTPQDINTTSSVTFGQIIDSGLSASELVVTNGSKQLNSLASPSLTEVGYLTGVTSGIQAQLGAISSQLPNYLLLSGGTMSGAIAMGTHKITGLANGTVSTDAAAFGQIPTFSASVQVINNLTFSATSNTYQASGLSAAITPSSASHRVKITMNTVGSSSIPANSNAIFTIFKNGVNLVSGPDALATVDVIGSSMISMSYIDSPASTSPLTYEARIRNTDNATTVTLGALAINSVVVLEEII